MPEIIVKSDYDGYFENLVRRWCDAKTTPFKSTTISVTAGPWRSEAVTCRRDGDVLHVDFYSALRSGFGSLSTAEVEQIKEKWL